MIHKSIQIKNLQLSFPHKTCFDDFTLQIPYGSRIDHLDLETRGHVIEVLKNYPGAMIVISHDADFLEEIGVNSYFKISGGYASFSAR